ncbi:MAG: hypothetical protein GY852_03685 [bacterium]|nr:hypothetical protein [bacterium]
MNKNKLRRIRKEIEKLRPRGGIKSKELESLAKKLGRKKHKRGKEPTWMSEECPERNAVTIPNHPGDLNKGLAQGILDQLESDLFYLEESTDTE